MTIKDILPQMMRSLARPAHVDEARSKLHAGGDAADLNPAVAFETLVKGFGGKAEERSSRISEAEEAGDEEKSGDMPPVKESPPISAIAAQAMLSFDPSRIKQVEAATAAGNSADALAIDVDDAGKPGAGRPDMGDEILVDESADAELYGTKADGKTAKPGDMAAVPVTTRQEKGHPAPDGTDKPDDKTPVPVSTDDKIASSGGGEGNRRQDAAKADPSASKPDLKEPAVKGRGGEAADSGAMTPNTQNRPGGANSSPGLANAAAAPVKQAIHIAGVEIVSERSYGTVKTLNIRLQPLDLGTVTARLRMVPDGMQVELVADRRETADRLAADRDMLGKALQSVGLSDNAVVAITVTERGNPATSNAAGNQAGQQNFTAQDQTGGRNGGHPQATMQGEGNGNRDQRRTWNSDDQAQANAPASPLDPRGGRRLSRGIVV
ncbi:flagellar hook-length control protein FliK [Phyllobacterium salinisoli]|uniref:Flagellar hook-length control protein FliK n=1 Tax=Phyllobacterium salinisoli TaxID=1899321 RepID=A0A368K464_9HYPH|nr:flagellar hook-length control protein FliK [Phyllobacterium salinisoli]RCS23984.1 flagellar hook-length control protein FliK [Phyllobacterium salinisoli]